jgi:hypothetical protein
MPSIIIPSHPQIRYFKEDDSSSYWRQNQFARGYFNSRSAEACFCCGPSCCNCTITARSTLNLTCPDPIVGMEPLDCDGTPNPNESPRDLDSCYNWDASYPQMNGIPLVVTINLTGGTYVTCGNGLKYAFTHWQVCSLCELSYDTPTEGALSGCGCIWLSDLVYYYCVYSSSFSVRLCDPEINGCGICAQAFYRVVPDCVVPDTDCRCCGCYMDNNFVSPCLETDNCFNTPCKELCP